MESIGIQLDKRTLSLIALLLLVFSIIGACFFLYPEFFISTKYGDTGLIRMIGLVTVVLSVPGLLILCKKISSPQLGLLIHAEGIVDNGTGSSIGLVEWKDIVSVRMIGEPTSKMLLIIVRVPEKYINQVNSRLARFFLRLNHRIYGSPIVIPTLTLKITADDLETVVMEAWKKKKRR
ncbi:MAG: Unknown protein [uncultured Aureispira sp.]|uniref:Uncharacterized protein n=1 Tax=uncultured Aureispira sp. TaxID=1331704 RepID=A0A6S6UH09_9BACT|nr:MAG: Unknown protein [uncultured Aureispira sp.]